MNRILESSYQKIAAHGPALFADECKDLCTDPAAKSGYHGSAAFVQYNACIGNALIAFSEGLAHDGYLAGAKVGDGKYVTEYVENGRAYIFALEADGKTHGGSFLLPDRKGREAYPQIGADTENLLSGIWLAAMMREDDLNPAFHILLEDTIQGIREQKNDAYLQPWLVFNIYKICDHLTQGVLLGDSGEEGKGIPIVLSAERRPKISITTDKLEAYEGKPVVGRFKTLSQDAKNGGGYTVKSFIEMPAVKEWRARRMAEMSEEEFMEIPVFDEGFVVPEECRKIVLRYITTRNDKSPVNCCGFFAPTGYGKSLIARLTANLLMLPYSCTTCADTTELDDFQYRWTPVTSDNGEVSYKLTLAPFARAFKEGGLHEIAEGSRIRGAALVGLNGYFDKDSFMVLADGSVVKRHPNCFVIYTDNVDYATSNDVDQSVRRRMKFILSRCQMTKERIISRVKYSTDFKDDKLLEKMYKAWEAIRQFMVKNSITDGAVEIEELSTWAQFVKLDDYANVYENCIDTVVTKATNSREDQDAIIASVLQTADLEPSMGGLR